MKHNDDDHECKPKWERATRQDKTLDEMGVGERERMVVAGRIWANCGRRRHTDARLRPKWGEFYQQMDHWRGSEQRRDSPTEVGRDSIKSGPALTKSSSDAGSNWTDACETSTGQPPKFANCASEFMGDFDTNWPDLDHFEGPCFGGLRRESSDARRRTQAQYK